MTNVRPIPEGYYTITPYLIVHNGQAALDFYRNAFGGTELFRMAGPDGKVRHSEMKIGNSIFMMADEFPEMNVRGPKSLGGAGVQMCLYVEDSDFVFNRAVEMGAKVVKPLQNQFYGDRSGTVIDPFGHQWTISTHIEDVSPEEIERRTAKLYGSGHKD